MVPCLRVSLAIGWNSMIRIIRWPSFGLSMLAAFLVMALLPPGCAWAAGVDSSLAAASATNISAKTSDDGPEEGSSLMAMGDFNRDGIADIAKATLPEVSSGPASLAVWIGQADGNFKLAASNPVLDQTPRSLVVGDFNKDGISDVIVGDDNGSLRLFLGDGRGNLVLAGDIARLNSVVSIAIADFNHDGVLDLAVTDWRGSSVTVLL